MIAAAEDIATILEAETEMVLGTDLFIGKELSKPDNCVTIFDISGEPADIALDGSSYQKPSIQLRIRNNNQLVASTLCQTLLGILDGLGNVVVGTTTYMIIYCSSGPALLDWDANERIRFIINFNIKRKE